MNVANVVMSPYNVRVPKIRKKVAPMAFRFTEDAAWLLEQIAESSAESKASILERLIRSEARRCGIHLQDKPLPAPPEP